MAPSLTDWARCAIWCKATFFQVLALTMLDPDHTGSVDSAKLNIFDSRAEEIIALREAEAILKASKPEAVAFHARSIVGQPVELHHDMRQVVRHEPRPRVSQQHLRALEATIRQFLCHSATAALTWEKQST